MGNLTRSLQGNLTIQREILTFEIKKFIRNSGKSDYVTRKKYTFQALHTVNVAVLTDFDSHKPR